MILCCYALHVGKFSCFRTGYSNQGKPSVSQCGGCYKCYGGNKTITMNSKQAEETVTPFLARHVPQQYAPLGVLSNSPERDRVAHRTLTNGLDKSREQMERPNTKYCYRHRPDMRCRRQADEPSMEQLQAVSPYKLKSWYVATIL